MQDIEDYFKRNNAAESYKLEIAKEAMEGKARNWFNLYENTWSSYTEFNTFVETYWLYEQQRKIHRIIVLG